MIVFGRPWFLLTFLFLALAVYIYRQKYQPGSLRFPSLQLVTSLPHKYRLRSLWLPDLLRLIVMSLLIISAARPQLSQQWTTLRGKGVDIVLALDISGSMAGLDFEPDTRFGAAKNVIHQFIDKRRYDRIGLVVFAKEAFRQSPPTYDGETLHWMLDNLELAGDLGLEDGTAIGMGLAQSISMLKNSQAASRVIILLTDSINNAGDLDPIAAARIAAAMDISVYTIGLGKSGQIPYIIDDPILGEKIQLVESEIDEETLQNIAALTGARYFHAIDRNELEEIYAEIDKMEKSDIEIQQYQQKTELANIFLFPSLLLLAIEIVIRNTIYRSIP